MYKFIEPDQIGMKFRKYCIYTVCNRTVQVEELGFHVVFWLRPPILSAIGITAIDIHN